jgi:hypothetical protein
MLSISLLRQPMQLVQNQAARAHLGVNIDPVAETSDKETAEITQGLYRRIEQDGKAQQARMWAFDRSKQCGRGYYRVLTQYDEDSDPRSPGAWDQEIAFERFLHQNAVYMDPAAQKADYSDAKWALIESWLTKGDFRDAFPGAKILPTQEGFAGMEKEQPDWVRASSGTKDPAVRVVEYWYKDIRKEVILGGPNGLTRKRELVKVYCAKTSGFEVLEEPQLWNGKHIPIVVIIGDELQPFDGQRRWEGMVRPARDGQMAYNYAISAAVEDISRLSKAPYIGYVGQFETDKDKWDSLNIRNYAYVEKEQACPSSTGDAD